MFYLYGFFLSRRIVFKQESNEDFVYSPKEQAIRYAIFLLVFRIFDASISFVMIDLFLISYFVVPLFVTGTLFVAKYFVYRKCVFKVVQK